MALDNLSAHHLFENWRTKFSGLFATASLGSEKIILVKPQTFMNLSGICVAKFKQFFKINVADIFVIYDDIDLGFERGKNKAGWWRCRAQGSKIHFRAFANKRF